MTDREKIIKALEIGLELNENKELESAEMSFEFIEILISMLKEQSEIVRCKDCKHRPTIPEHCESGFDLQFPDEKCPCQCEDGWYSWCPADDWFCADGERKEKRDE